MGGEEYTKDLKINGERMDTLLHESCQYGVGQRWGSGSTETGMSRLALSDSDKEVRDWFVTTTKRLGCNVIVDAMGNIFAVRPGKRDGWPTYIGSHLDTQPRGGRYDGILGVLAGVEVLQALNDYNVETEYPVGVVNWTNEEGARFPMITVASGVWAGEISLERAHNLHEVGGGTATMKSELSRIGYLGSTPASYRAMSMAAYFELHIEQGPILEANNQKIGVVIGVQAYKWFTVDIIGQVGHTGTTPLSERADALLLAARMITLSNRVATKHAAIITTGILNVSPASVNTIPGHVRFTLDVRAPTDSIIDAIEAELKQDYASLAAGENVGGLLDGATPGKPLEVSWQTDSVSPATKFHPKCIDLVRASAESVTESKLLVRDIMSGAGHDSVHTNKRCPTAMVFVPSKNGISHNPKEYTSPEDCALGAEVLLQSVLKYDRVRSSEEIEW
ncbi:amidase [Hypoxylon sp. EC38]|nr:amidase [Hypoxylon sp. EC38]